MSIQVKSNKVLENLLVHRYHKDLSFMLNWISVRYSDLVVTSGYRVGDTGVHGTDPCRGMDIRSWIYSNPQGIVDDINEHFIYDTDRPKKKCAMLHSVGDGMHIHLQVHPKSIYVEDGLNVTPI